MQMESQKLDSYTLPNSDLTIKAGDCVYIRPSEPKKPPYVGKVSKFVADGDGNNVKVKFQHFYRPADINPKERQDWHGEKELFLSEHWDLVSVATIQRKCTVYPLEEYEKLKEVEEDEFFCRLEYDAGQSKLIRKTLELHCKCKKPVNPDKIMAQCDRCKDWYHSSCIGKTKKEVEKLKHYFCEACSSRPGKKMKFNQDGSDAPPKVDKRRLPGTSKCFDGKQNRP